MSNKALNSISEITDVVARVTRILSGRSIQVVQEGLKLGVEYDAKGVPTRVYLPSLTDNPSPELLSAIHGFIDKEVASLLYTDHDYKHRNQQVGPFKSKGMARVMQEVIEGSRTERAMKREFAGSAVNFSKNHDFAIREVLTPELASKSLSQKDRMALLTMPAIRAAAGDLEYEQFMDDKWEEMGKLGGAILHYADDIQNIDTTKGTFDLTQKIIRYMEEQPEPDEDDDDSDEEGEGDGPGQGSAGGSDGDGDDGDGSGGAGGGEGDEEGDDADSGAGGGEDDDDSDGDNSGKKSPYEDLSKSNKKLAERKKQQRDKASDGSDAGSGTQQGLTLFEDMDSAYQAMDFNSRYEAKIKKFAKDDQVAAPYVPYSRQYDYVGPFPDEKGAIAQFNSDNTGKRIYEAAAKDSHVIQQQVQKLFMAKSLTRWEPGLKRGKINASSLYKLRNGDPRVFRRKIESDSRDLAVTLLLDMSGSMSNAKIQYAAIAALMFSDVLTKLNIAHEISAFSTYTGRYSKSGKGMPSSDDVNKMLHSVGRSYYGGSGGSSDPDVKYARFTPLTNFIAKGFDDRLNEDTKRLISMIPSGYSHCMSGNVDGESVQIAGERLLRRKEKRKIMIVMSDGSPAGDSSGPMLDMHLKSVVKNFEAAGVEMLGLGLMDTSVKRYYPRNQVITKIEEIPTKILELTQQLVVGAK